VSGDMAATGWMIRIELSGSLGEFHSSGAPGGTLPA